MPAFGGDSIVVVALSGEASGDGVVSDEVDEVRAVAEFVLVLGEVEAGPGEVGFPAIDAVELVGVTDRLMNLQAELAGHEDEVGLSGWADGGGGEGDGFFPDALGVFEELGGADEFVAAALVDASKGHGIGSNLDFSIVDGGGAVPGADADDLLNDPAAFGVGEVLLLFEEAHHRLGAFDFLVLAEDFIDREEKV